MSGDTVSANAVSVFYNDISVGYAVDKITLTGITLTGAAVGNYETAETQTVFGQISYALDSVIFRRITSGGSWYKFYPVDSASPVDGTTADYHSPIDNGVYDAHCDYVYARTENKGSGQSVYAVDIEFGAMSFSYSKSLWNPNTMVYEEQTGQSRWTGFDGVGNRVTVTNRSNSVVYYTANARIDFLHSAVGGGTVGITASLRAYNSPSATERTGIKQELAAAAAGNSRALGTAAAGSCYVILSGVPQLSDSDRFTAVGNVTVTISRE